MLLISQLVNLWRQRLVRARTQASDPYAATGGEWLWLVRIRIYSFLVSRYSEPAAARREQSLMDLAPPSLDTALFEVEAVEAAPRSREHLGRALRAIHTSNLNAWRASRWRWFL